MKTVFVPMSADPLHSGHINIIKVARELGEVTVGLATDQVNSRYKQGSLMSYGERKTLVENISGVSRVIPQDTLDLVPNLRNLQPDYLVHGDDWRTGPLIETRQRALDVLEEWGGRLIEPPYTRGISSTRLKSTIRSMEFSAESRRHRLGTLFREKPMFQVVAVHDGLSARIVERSHIQQDGEVRGFDAMWLSKRAVSLAKARWPTSSIDLISQASPLLEVLSATTKPLLVDSSGAGDPDHLAYEIETLDGLGVSALVVDDRIDSHTDDPAQWEGSFELQHVDDFARIISRAKEVRWDEAFFLVSKINSLHLHADLRDASRRAVSYIRAGADALIIKASLKKPEMILDFCRTYQEFEYGVPLIAELWPNSKISLQRLADAGVRAVIHGDSLLRCSYSSMQKTLKTILSASSTSEEEQYCTPWEDIVKILDRN